MIRTTKPKKKDKGGRPPRKPTDKLTPKEQEFADLYLLNKGKEKPLPKYKCYMKVFPRTKSKMNANVLACKLMKRLPVKRYIDEVQKKIQDKLEIKMEHATKGYLQIAKFDHRKLYDKNKKVLHIADLDDDTAMGLSSIEFGLRTIKKKMKGKTNSTQKAYLKTIKTETRKAAWDSIVALLGLGVGKGNDDTADNFVANVRGFADAIDDAVPGGKI